MGSRSEQRSRERDEREMRLPVVADHVIASAAAAGLGPDGVHVRLTGKRLGQATYLGQALEFREDGVRRHGTYPYLSHLPTEAPVTPWSEIAALDVDIERGRVAVRWVDGTEVDAPVRRDDVDLLHRVEPLRHRRRDTLAHLLLPEIRTLALALRDTLRDEGFPEHVPGVEGLLGEVDAVPDRQTPEEALDRAESVFRSMVGGPGRLDDVVLWHDDPEERTRRNEAYHGTRVRLGAVLRDRSLPEWTT